MLQRCRAFNRLPPNLRELSAHSKRWAIYNDPNGSVAGIDGIEDWYDEDGNELNPNAGTMLTDEEIDEEWDNLPWDQPDIEVEDIPIPAGGFADPETWKKPEDEEEEEDDQDAPTEDGLTKDISSHGREYVARYYGIPKDQLSEVKSDKELACLIIDMRGARKRNKA